MNAIAYLPAAHQLLAWLRTHGPADRDDVPPELEDALTLCLTDTPPLAHVFMSQPRPAPMPPTVVKLARDLQPGDVIENLRAVVVQARPVAGGVEVAVRNQPDPMYYRRTGGREPRVEVYAGRLPIPVEPRTLVALTPSGEAWLRRTEALRRMAPPTSAEVPAATSMELPPTGRKYPADGAGVPAEFRELGRADGAVLTVQYLEECEERWGLRGPYVSKNYGPGKHLTTYVRVGKARAYLYPELRVLVDKRNSNQEAAEEMKKVKRAKEYS